MPITPEEARVLTSEETAELKNLDKKLIAHVRQGAKKHYMPGFVVPNRTTDRVVRELIHQWEEAGWSVRFQHGTQRDPEDLLFISQPPQPQGESQ